MRKDIGPWKKSGNIFFKVQLWLTYMYTWCRVKKTFTNNFADFSMGKKIINQTKVGRMTWLS